MALDLLLLNQLQRLNRHAGFNEYYPRRPLFAYYSGANSASQFVLDVYSEYTTIPMRTFYGGQNTWGTPPSVAIATSTESLQSYYWGGNSSGTASTNGPAPTTGFTGITAHCQTRCLNNIDLNSEQFFSNNYNNTASLEMRAGVILGEPGYRQGLNLYKSGANIYISYIGDNNTLNYGLGLTAGDKGFAWNTLTGLSRLAFGVSAGLGDIGYNRKTNTLAFIEGTGDTNYSYRLHIFKNLPKLRASGEHLRVALNAAIAGGGTTYETFDFSWPGINDSEWHQRTRIIPCDDGTFWLSRQASGSSGLWLGRVYFSSGATRTFESIRTLATSNAGSSVNTTYCGVRHMVSDDGNVVACYHQYYYNLCGVCAVFVPRSSAAPTGMLRYSYIQITDTTNGYSIAPAGGPNFVIGINSNADSRSQDGFATNFDNPLTMNQSQLSVSTAYYSVSGFPQSTSYGGTGFVKVQDPLVLTTEWRERPLNT